jgi:hypothetical protein
MSLLPGDHVVDLAAVPEAAEGPFQLRLSDLRQTPVQLTDDVHSLKEETKHLL